MPSPVPSLSLSLSLSLSPSLPLSLSLSLSLSLLRNSDPMTAFASPFNTVGGGHMSYIRRRIHGICLTLSGPIPKYLSQDG
jgi:hypothetical protein